MFCFVFLFNVLSFFALFCVVVLPVVLTCWLVLVSCLFLCLVATCYCYVWLFCCVSFALLVGASAAYLLVCVLLCVLCSLLWCVCFVPPALF